MLEGKKSLLTSLFSLSVVYLVFVNLAVFVVNVFRKWFSYQGFVVFSMLVEALPSMAFVIAGWNIGGASGSWIKRWVCRFFCVPVFTRVVKNLILVTGLCLGVISLKDLPDYKQLIQKLDAQLR